MDALSLELAQLPLYHYAFLDPGNLEFSQRVRWICQQECPMYGRTWSCPPAVGSVQVCRDRCLEYGRCLLIATVQETGESPEDALRTHRALACQVRDLLRAQGEQPYILSAKACQLCSRCAYPEGSPCRNPEKMHPCLEGHGINILPTLEQIGLEFQYGGDAVTWISLVFYRRKGQL